MMGCFLIFQTFFSFQLVDVQIIFGIFSKILA